MTVQVHPDVVFAAVGKLQVEVDVLRQQKVELIETVKKLRKQLAEAGVAPEAPLAKPNSE